MTMNQATPARSCSMWPRLRDTSMRNTLANSRATRGFTLLELLVVIAIIGILSTVVLASLNASRANSRDAARKAQIEEILKAFVMYEAANGTYNTGGGASGQAFFNRDYDGAGPNTSIAQALSSAGFFGGTALDPLVSDPNASQNLSGQTPYFVLGSLTGLDNGVCVFAQLENPTGEDLATFAAAPTVGTAPAACGGVGSGSSQKATLCSWGLNYAQCLGE